MSIHTVTESILVQSQVEVLAPPGERTEAVARIARKEVDRVCEQAGLIPPPIDITISPPVYQDGRKWLVRITYHFQSTMVVDLVD